MRLQLRILGALAIIAIIAWLLLPRQAKVHVRKGLFKHEVEETQKVLFEHMVEDPTRGCVDHMDGSKSCPPSSQDTLVYDHRPLEEIQAEYKEHESEIREGLGLD